MNRSELDFLKSAVTQDSPVFSNERVVAWIQERRNATRVDVQQVAINQLLKWEVERVSGNIRHESGKFFAIEGIRVETNWGNVARWDQPIINQPEIGFLGFLAKKINGVLHLLIQAKIEPGNVNVVQISPTLQATKSNYTRVHQGNRPRYLEYFNGEKKVKILLDQLQSEQGARFLRKRNRNIIVQLDDDETIEPHADFAWLTIGQLKLMMLMDNVVNMDTRTVISGIGYGSCPSPTIDYLLTMSPQKVQTRKMLGSLLNDDLMLHDFREILSWITRLKSSYELTVDRIALRAARDWSLYDGVLRRSDEKYFSVIGVDVSIENREVVRWHQPMVKPAQDGLIAFIVRPIHGVYHFLVQAKLEAGNFDIIELAPTVQCLTGNYRTGHNEYSVPYINEVLSAPSHHVLFDVVQSEEGGRFYQEQNRNMIVEVGEDFPLEVDEHYCWLTLNQILRLIEFNNYLNIAARSLISAVSVF